MRELDSTKADKKLGLDRSQSRSQPKDFSVFKNCIFWLIRHIVELIQLLETNILGVLPEALTAHVQVVLADHSMSVRAGTAVKRKTIGLKLELKIIVWSKINLLKIKVSFNKRWVSGKVKSTLSLSLSKQPNSGPSKLLYPH